MYHLNAFVLTALTAESEQRVLDHEQYVESLAAVTAAVRGLQGVQSQEEHGQELRSEQLFSEDKRVRNSEKLDQEYQAARGCQEKLKSAPSLKSRPENLVLQALQGKR